MTLTIEVLRRFLRDSAHYLGLTLSPRRWQGLLAQPAAPVQRRLPAQDRNAVGCR